MRSPRTETPPSKRRSTLQRVAIFLLAIVGLLAIPVVVDALTSPRTFVDSPTQSSTVSGDLTVAGSARHRKGVSEVELVVKNLDDNTYWNGSGWQKRFIRFPIAVDRPGASNTTWSYTLAAENMERGNYRARAFARSVEGNGDRYGGDQNDFRYAPASARDYYDTEVTEPGDGSTISGSIVVQGQARSVEGVAAVEVVVRNTDNDRYWDGKAGSWTNRFVRTSASLATPGGTDTGWTLTIPADQSTEGNYFTRAWVRTTTGKGDPFGRGQASFTVDSQTPPPGGTSTTVGPPTTAAPTTAAPTTAAPTTAAPTTAAPTTAAPTTAAPTTAAPTTTRPAGAQVVWEDNFDTLNQARWKLEHSTYGDGNNELQCYRPQNVSVADGRLVLRAATESYTCPNGSTRLVTSGMVRSRGVSFGPGQAIEFRVKLTPADENDQGGLWPGVWSSGWAGGGWPRSGELDFLEVMTANDPKRSIYSIHYAKPDGSHGKTNKPVFGSENFSASWHTVRFDYGRDGKLVWHLDGEVVSTVTDADTAQGYPAPFDQTTNEIKINLALGGRPGPLAPGAVGRQGATFEVDYIRVVTLG